MKVFKPYVFYDDDQKSNTFGLWCIRLTETISLDGYESEADALNNLVIELEKV